MHYVRLIEALTIVFAEEINKIVQTLIIYINDLILNKGDCQLLAIVTRKTE